MYCKTCGKENPEGTIECSTCGSNVNEGNMYCPKCGHFKLPGDTQCVNCGCNLTEEVSLKTTIQNPVEVAPPPASETTNTDSGFNISAPAKDESKKYCRNCGLIIDKQSLRCPFCDAEENSASKYCPNCGMITTPQDTSCAYCGAVFAQPQPQPQPTPQPQPAPQPQPQPQPSYQQNIPSYQQPQNNYNAPYVQSAPPAQTQRQNYIPNKNVNNSDVGTHSFIATLLLHLFLGYLGIHRFYTGNYVAGILQFFTAGGCGVWWVIDLILIVVGTYRDGDGKLLARDV